MSIIERAIKRLEGKAGLSPTIEPEKAMNDLADKVEERQEHSVPPASEQPQAAPKPAVDVNDIDDAQAAVIHVPFARLSTLGMITPNTPNSPIAEEFRGIKRPLLMNIVGQGAASVDHPNLIMVASALSGEGKTFSAVNLAMSIAMEQDKSVLFVDADISKASAGALLGVPSDSPGLIDLLEDKGLSFQDVVLKTNIPNLRILPAGNLHERSTELLASEDMRSLMAELSQRYADRVIVFDSPPLLLTTEARVLANLMGQIVFVVAAEQTSQEAVVEALQFLSSDSIVGMVLNKAHHQSAARYGYGYGYGYGGRAAGADAGA